MISVKEAQDLISKQARRFGMEKVSIMDALGKILAEDVHADRDYPPFNRSAMDGYAIVADDFLKNNIREFEILEEVFAGSIATKKLSKGFCYKIMTGASVPDSADTVIRVEDAEEHGRKVFFKTEKLKKGQNIAERGEDKTVGEIILKKNTILNPPAISALAVLGKYQVEVINGPSVSIISTGDEIVSIYDPVLPYQIRDSNSYAIEAFFKTFNITISNREIVADKKEKLKSAISRFIDSDILILSGGVSMGDADFVPEILTSLGVKNIFHKVKLKPGKPIWFGALPNGGVVFGLPGNPMSAQVCYKIFIETYLRRCLGLPPQTMLKLPLLSTKNKKVNLEEYFPCKIEESQKFGLVPMVINGSGDITSTLYSHGLAIHEEERGEIKEGELVNFLSWDSL